MKLKPNVFPILYICLIFTLVVGLYFTSRAMNMDMEDTSSNLTYVLIL